MEEIKINCRWTSQPLEVLKHCTGEHLAHIKSNIWCFLLCTGTGWKAKYTTPDYIYYVLHVPFTCSACSSYMLYMFLLHVLHVPFTCSACSKVMFNMYLLHVQYVQSTCSTCTFYMFSMFKGHVLHVPFACSVCHFTFTLRTSVSHNSLKSSPIYTIFIYLSSLYWFLDVDIVCDEILWFFYSAIFGSAKQLSTHNFLIPPFNCIKQSVISPGARQGTGIVNSWEICHRVIRLPFYVFPCQGLAAS